LHSQKYSKLLGAKLLNGFGIRRIPKNLNTSITYHIVNNGGVRLQDKQSTIDRIKAKQLAFKQLKINNILKEKTQEAFNEYINPLPKEQPCKYMTGISEIINLCNNKFECKFKGEIYKSFTKNPKKECLRQRTLRFEKMLEH